MKLVVQIPCFNEAKTLESTLRGIPRHIANVDEIEILVVDDGSADETTAIAADLGVEHIVRHRTNRGLAAAFSTGIECALARDADIIVNTDGDNQYEGADIEQLIQPIIQNQADVVIGNRQTWKAQHFSLGKRCLQWFGSFVVRRLSGASVDDAVSGFRAFSREAAIRLNLVNSFSHTIETIIQCRRKNLAITSVPIRCHRTTRPSRLFRSTLRFLLQSTAVMLRSYAMYSPLWIFFVVSLLPTLLGVAAIARFVFYYSIGLGEGHIQSVVLGGVCLVLGFLISLAGVMADLIAINRQLLEQMMERLRRIDLASRKDDIPRDRAAWSLCETAPETYD